MVLTLSKEAPVCAGLLIVEIMTEAGFPSGVLNVVTQTPGEVGPVADELFESCKVRAYSFTGSSTTGAMLGALRTLCYRQLQRSQFGRGQPRQTPVSVVMGATVHANVSCEAVRPDVAIADTAIK